MMFMRRDENEQKRKEKRKQQQENSSKAKSSSSSLVFFSFGSCVYLHEIAQSYLLYVYCRWVLSTLGRPLRRL
jgi:NhaP-type Na+/H+ or K+/H+ antiporter